MCQRHWCIRPHDSGFRGGLRGYTSTGAPPPHTYPLFVHTVRSPESFYVLFCCFSFSVFVTLRVCFFFFFLRLAYTRGPGQLLSRAPTRDRKVAGSSPDKSGGRIFFSRVLTLLFSFCADSNLVSVPPHVTAVARKRHRQFCQKCRRQVSLKHAYTLDPTKSKWADYAVQAQCGNLSQKTSSHATHHKTLGHSHLSSPSHCWLILAQKSGIRMRELISTQKKKRRGKKKERVQAGNESPFPQIHASDEETTTGKLVNHYINQPRAIQPSIQSETTNNQPVCFVVVVVMVCFFFLFFPFFLSTIGTLRT